MGGLRSRCADHGRCGVSVPYLIFPRSLSRALYPLAYNQVSIMAHPFSESTPGIVYFFGVVWNISGFFKQLFGPLVLISFRSSGEFHIALRLHTRKSDRVFRVNFANIL